MTNPSDNSDRLEQFRVAQNARDGGVATAVAELKAGRKRSHWIWYIFPQLAGLGRSGMAERFGIRDLDEAVAYLEDPVLRGRLFEVAAVVADQVGTPGQTLTRLMGGSVDALKIVSSLTLFEVAARRLEGVEVREFLDACARILAVAEAQGFSRCEFTREKVG